MTLDFPGISDCCSLGPYILHTRVWIFVCVSCVFHLGYFVFGCQYWWSVDVSDLTGCLFVGVDDLTGALHKF